MAPRRTHPNSARQARIDKRAEVLRREESERHSTDAGKLATHRRHTLHDDAARAALLPTSQLKIVARPSRCAHRGSAIHTRSPANIFHLAPPLVAPFTSGHPPITMTTASVSALGPGLASRMSMEQLQAAYLLYSSINHVATNVNAMSLAATRQTFMNHLKSIVRMPHGGAAGGGSQQTGFEMELVSSTGANALFAGWPNYQSSHAGHRQSWELRSMEDLLLLKLHEKPAGWGAMMGKPIPMAPGRTSHVGLLLCAPPFTATWVQRHDGTTSLCVRFPLVLWTEADAVILPPDDAEGVPFFVDPPL